MSELGFVIFELAGEPYAIERQALEEAHQRALALLPRLAKPSAELPTQRLCTAQELEQATSVPATWWEHAARLGTVPCYRLGKYVRFSLAEAVEASRHERRG